MSAVPDLLWGLVTGAGNWLYLLCGIRVIGITRPHIDVSYYTLSYYTSLYWFGNSVFMGPGCSSHMEGEGGGIYPAF